MYGPLYEMPEILYAAVLVIARNMQVRSELSGLSQCRIVYSYCVWSLENGAVDVIR